MAIVMTRTYEFPTVTITCNIHDDYVTKDPKKRQEHLDRISHIVYGQLYEDAARKQAELEKQKNEE